MNSSIISSTGEEEDVKKYLEIDEFNLDREWQTYPAKFMEVCQKSLDSQQAFNDAKALLERDTAKYQMDIRENTKCYTANPKLTETLIEAIIALQSRIQNLKKDLLEKQYIKDRYGFLVKAMECKRKSLENMVHLMGLQYYSEPKQKGSDVKSVAVNQEMRKSFKRSVEESVFVTEEANQNERGE